VTRAVVCLQFVTMNKGIPPSHQLPLQTSSCKSLHFRVPLHTHVGSSYTRAQSAVAEGAVADRQNSNRTATSTVSEETDYVVVGSGIGGDTPPLSVSLISEISSLLSRCQDCLYVSRLTYPTRG